jgi:hypothetical protein
MSVTRRAVLRAGAGTAAAAVVSGAAAGCTSDDGGQHHERHQNRPRAQVAAAPRRGKRVVDVVADFGAKGDGRTDDSEAFARAYRHAASRVTGGTGRTVVSVPPGAFLIRSPHALLNGDQPQRKANGLRFAGGGKRVTEIVFQPERGAGGGDSGGGAGQAPGAGAFLCRNDNMWANISFERMRFRSATPGASFFSSYSQGQAQDYRFSECEWSGEWSYGLALGGTDTNSEMRWEACRIGGSYREAFLYSGVARRGKESARQDQFLNYWFTDMKVEYEWGDFLNFPYGGSITCRGGSYIVTGRRPSSAHARHGDTSTFFRFPRAHHPDSVQRFHAEDIRFEVRDPRVRVIDCAWDAGTVHFNDCDDTSNAFKDFSAGLAAHRYRLGDKGPLIRYDMCRLVGRHRYETTGSRADAPPLARYDMCHFRSHPQRDFADVHAGSGGAGAGVRFTDCTGDG